MIKRNEKNKKVKKTLIQTTFKTWHFWVIVVAIFYLFTSNQIAYAEEVGLGLFEVFVLGFLFAFGITLGGYWGYWLSQRNKK